MDVLIPIHNTFLCMHKEHLSTISDFCRNMEPYFLLTLTRTRLCIGVENGGGYWEQM